jgi:carbohydrate kinase (thermoresistant glucokinase family)
MALHLVFMGVSGTGKSAVGKPVAERLGLEFAEGDDFHPQANIDKMRGGTPLTDVDRWPWLEALAEWTRAHDRAGRATGLTCSALRRPYRDVLRQDVPDTVFVHLVGEREVILERMRLRDHFMPPELLDSQLATLELLEPEEHGLVVDIGDPLEVIVADVARRFADRV